MEWERLRRREMQEGKKCKGKAERVEKNENQERTADSARGGAGQRVGMGLVRVPGCAHLGGGWWRRSEHGPAARRTLGLCPAAGTGCRGPGAPPAAPGRSDCRAHSASRPASHRRPAAQRWGVHSLCTGETEVQRQVSRGSGESKPASAGSRTEIQTCE